MKIIARAFYVLSNPGRRAEYDASLTKEKASSHQSESYQGTAHSKQRTTGESEYSNQHDNKRSSDGENDAEGTSDNIRKYYEAAIGPNKTDYYLKRFEKYDKGGSTLSWNWGAFLSAILLPPVFGLDLL